MSAYFVSGKVLASTFAMAAVLALGLSACGGGDELQAGPITPTQPTGTPSTAPTVAPIVCKDYNNQDVVFKPKTITIRNNSDGQIYPVLATSTNAVN